MKSSNLLSLSFAFSSTVAGLPTDIEASTTSALDKRAFAGPPNPNRVVNLHTNTIYDYYVRIAEGPGDCILFGSNLGGQQFDTDGWNVIAIKMNCNAPGVWTVDQWPAQP
ncbi:hypothetical protein FAVG1_10855 [Fusarium avenaceum]|nr:hypothetical protein FAVG1_10855 [Fusarium avenaceum]